MDATPTLQERLANAGALRLFSAPSTPAADARPRAEAIARALRDMGLGRGDRLAAVLPNGTDFVSLFLACVQREVTFVPLHPGLPAADVLRRCRLAGVRGLWDGDGIRRLGPSESAVPPSTPRPAVLLFTSGSEGEARPVALSARTLLHVVDTHHAALGYGPGTEVLGFLPWSHAFGFTLELLMGLLYGAALRPVAAAAFPEAFLAAPGDYLFTVPRMLERLPAAQLRRLQGGIVGGAAVRGPVRQQLLGTRLRVGYGQTECGPGVSLGEAGEWTVDGFLGRPLGCDVVLRPSEDAATGEVLVRGSNLAQGYANGETLLPLGLVGGWRATGDLATASGDGGFVFQGRRDELFKLDNGRMVNPVPLELPYAGRILLVGQGRTAVQPLAREEVPDAFALPLPHLPPRLMPEAFWTACTTETGKVSRRRAESLFYRE